MVIREITRFFSFADLLYLNLKRAFHNMNIYRTSVTFVLTFILATLLFSLQFPLLVIILTVFVFFLAFNLLPTLYTIYRSNNLKSIEKYIQANKKKPIFAYPLALAHGNEVEIEESLRAIIEKHKQPYMQNVYKTLLALHLKNIEVADTYAQRIDSEPLQSYYAALIAAKQGNFEEAARHEENVGVQWMIHALHALYAKEKGQHELSAREAQQAINHSRGIQKYIVVHSVGRI